MKKIIHLLFISFILMFLAGTMSSCASKSQCGKSKRWHKQKQGGMGDWMERR